VIGHIERVSGACVYRLVRVGFGVGVGFDVPLWIPA
jgi:hypothetical protein